jgi:diguanylate cyclase (GGDEF)-like protein/PAS domain S-box-containing protein
MQSAELRENEEETLAALAALNVLDSPPDEEFDALVRCASLVCGVPIALVSLIDASRQWFKANVGLPEVTQLPRESAFCAHAVLADGLLEVPDALLDPRFADNPLVTEEPRIRFYAGAPVSLRSGHRVGTLCVIDRQPRALSDAQREVLNGLALAVARALEGRLATLQARKHLDFLDRSGSLAGVGGWEVDIATQHITWSDETRRIHGVDAHYQPVLSEAINFYAPDARPVIHAAIERAVATGEPWDLELPFIRADGRAIWTRGVGKAEFKDGKPVRLFGAFQDVTDRKTLEFQLSAASAEVRDLYDNAPCGYQSLDAEGRFVHVNATALRWLGVSHDELIGKKSILDFFTAEGRALFQQNFDRFKREGRIEGLEFELVSAQGTVRTVSVTATAVNDAAGNFLMSRTVMFDITERKAAEKSARELVTIFDNTSDFVVQTDRLGKLSYMNPALRRAMGIPADAPVTQLTYSSFNMPQTQRLHEEVIEPALQAGAPVWLGEATICLADRREVSVSKMVIAHRDNAGSIARLSIVLRDISNDVASRLQLARQTAKLVSVTEAIPALVAVVGSEGTYRFVNTAFENWWGLRRENILGRKVGDVIGEQELERRMPWVQRAFAGETVQFVLDYPSRDGATYMDIHYAPLRLESGEVDGFVVVSNDVTHQKQEELRLRQLSQRDPLTGLLNRAGFDAHLDHISNQGSDESLALLYIDLDHFKPINDTHGHPAGDQILKIFAHRLVNLVRPSDAVARLGGDEFAIVLSGAKEHANMRTVADKVLLAAQSPFHVGGLLLQINASVGIAFDAQLGAGWAGLIERADANLLAAKAAGKGRHAGAD